MQVFSSTVKIFFMSKFSKIDKKNMAQAAITGSELTLETLQQGVKYVQS